MWKSSWCYLVLLLQEGELLFLCSVGDSQHVAQRHIFKSLRLPDVIIYTPKHNIIFLKVHQFDGSARDQAPLFVCVWLLRTVGNVDPGWYAAASEGENVQRGEVRLEEGVLLKLPRPRQLGQQHLGRAHQLGEAFAHRLVHHGHETCRRRASRGSGLGTARPTATSHSSPRLTFKLSSGAEGVSVALYEADVAERRGAGDDVT